MNVSLDLPPGTEVLFLIASGCLRVSSPLADPHSFASHSTTSCNLHGNKEKVFGHLEWLLPLMWWRIWLKSRMNTLQFSPSSQKAVLLMWGPSSVRLPGLSSKGSPSFLSERRLGGRVWVPQITGVEKQGVWWSVGTEERCRVLERILESFVGEYEGNYWVEAADPKALFLTKTSLTVRK